MTFHNHKSTEFVLLIRQGVSDWMSSIGKSRGTFHRHEQNQMHKESVEKANVLMSNTENNKSREEKIYSVSILLSILDVILR